MTEQVDTIIVGGGQGGLSTSYYLRQQGCEHVILEQADQAAEVWRNRWDSFTLNTPNWMTRLPGAEYQGNDPDGFMPRDEVVAYFEEYIERFNLPIRFGCRVTSVAPIEAGYLVSTDEGEFEAANVVIAAGLHQQPKIPPFSTNLPAEIRQLHSSEYRNPEALPAGAVLVVGSAQSGCQIAEELYQSGRKVYLSVSSSPRIPRAIAVKTLPGGWMLSASLTRQWINFHHPKPSSHPARIAREKMAATRSTCTNLQGMASCYWVVSTARKRIGSFWPQT